MPEMTNHILTGSLDLKSLKFLLKDEYEFHDNKAIDRPLGYFL